MRLAVFFETWGFPVAVESMSYLGSGLDAVVFEDQGSAHVGLTPGWPSWLARWLAGRLHGCLVSRWYLLEGGARREDEGGKRKGEEEQEKKEENEKKEGSKGTST